MMETFLEDAENSLHHRTNTGSNGSGSSDESDDPLDDPFLYDKFLPDPYWAKAEQLEQAKPKNLVDPGLFRYNKRVFVTSLPALLLVLALGGETLVLITAVGTAVITIMSQMGDSRRCVIFFIVMFIPTHAYILATVLPLLWLSMWHFFLVVLTNLFIILTAAWVLLQFKAFRMEETELACIVELLLFTLYPLACTSLVSWALGAVVSISLIPVIFSMMWFVLLQLYLVPTLSSFRSQTTAEENLDVIQVPVVVVTVVGFVLCGPLLHVMLAVFAVDTQPLFSVISLTHLAFILSLTCFLSTLLSVRQIFEYMGLPYTTAIYVRWVSGSLCTLLCYPVLHTYGLDSHFLPLLPVAIAMFAALGVVLAFKRRRMIMAVLALVLLSSLAALFLLWIQGMPHNLQHYFMGIFPLNVFYLMICINFFLCLLCLWTASIDNKSMLGFLLFVQSLMLTVCEVSLHNGQLYSTSLLQLTSVSAMYTLHRLHVAEKISGGAATMTSAIQCAKSMASCTSLVLDGGKGEISLLEMAALGCLAYAVLSVFVYHSTGEKTTAQMGKQLLLLLAAVAVNSHHLLLPLSLLMFQGYASYSNIIGLWCLLCGGLTLLYSQTTGSTVTAFIIIRVALLLSIMGVVIMLLHPQLSYSLLSIFQWAEILSSFALAVLVSHRPTMHPQGVFVCSILFAVCPGIRACLYLWSVFHPLTAGLCIVNSAALLMLFFICFLITEWTEATETMMKTSMVLAGSSSLCLLVLDVIGWLTARQSADTLWGPARTFCQQPAWIVVLLTCLAISLILKVVQATKGLSKLPLTHEEGSSRLSLPLLANIVTLVAFAVACTQGPREATLHDLWCCAATVIFGCLHKDSVILPRLDGDKQATPTIMASFSILVLATVLRSRFWDFAFYLSVIGGFFEVLMALVSIPIFYVMWGILWKGEVLSEPAVVFLTPYSFLLVMCATSYSAWLLALATLVSGMWMMMYRLPMVPYGVDYEDRFR
ncbi:uncharacterized protein LOC101863811 [Aplysia californica]|uniref:Uncharacterized protein LOC101863811 n=1 Tax=Aplysia californica TaxID=6500 RepID=A0ABM0JMG5_APLCA|nr:uncharacterized protein LOC101863811 [Aplysia californica]